MMTNEGPLSITTKKCETLYSRHTNSQNVSGPHPITAMEVPSSVNRTTAVDILTNQLIVRFERSVLVNDQNGFKLFEYLSKPMFLPVKAQAGLSNNHDTRPAAQSP